MAQLYTRVSLWVVTRVTKPAQWSLLQPFDEYSLLDRADVVRLYYHLLSLLPSCTHVLDVFQSFCLCISSALFYQLCFSITLLLCSDNTHHVSPTVPGVSPPPAGHWTVQPNGDFGQRLQRFQSSPATEIPNPQILVGDQLCE